MLMSQLCRTESEDRARILRGRIRNVVIVDILEASPPPPPDCKVSIKTQICNNNNKNIHCPAYIHAETYLYLVSAERTSYKGWVNTEHHELKTGSCSGGRCVYRRQPQAHLLIRNQGNDGRAREGVHRVHLLHLQGPSSCQRQVSKVKPELPSISFSGPERRYLGRSSGWVLEGRVRTNV